MNKFAALARLDGVAQAELVKTGELSAAELLEAAQERWSLLNPLIHAVVSTNFEAATARARAVASGSSPLAGVPFLLKDLLAYPGLRWSMGSRLFAHNQAPGGSPFTHALDRAGLVTFGKTASSELGLLGSTETLLEGVTHNPWDLSLSAAGSSGGAAAAVAAGLVPVAHASDGGGSIRVPASVCGLFGFKPSRGRCVAAGEAGEMSGLLSDLSVSRTVRDTAAILSITEAPGPTAVGLVTGPSRRRLRIGAWSNSLMGTQPDPEVQRAYESTASLLGELGHTVEEVTPPPALNGRGISDAFFTLAGASMAGLAAMMSQHLGRPVGPKELEPFTLSLIEDHLRRPAEEVAAARAALTTLARDYLAATAPYEVVMTPTLATPPWKLGTLNPTLDRATLIGATEARVAYTPIHNMAGCAAMSVPLYWTEASNLPIGSHFAAAPGQDALLLALAFELEAARPWKQRWAPYSVPALLGV